MKVVEISLKEEYLFGIAFIGLNMLDALLTRVILAFGGTELTPFATGFGGSILLKGLISSAIAMALILFKRGRLLKPLDLGMLLIVLWNCAAVWSWR